MRLPFKKLIILALFASMGLLFLQGFWLIHEWKRNKEVVERQASTALREAVSQELEIRRDSLRRYLANLLNDTTVFTFSTFYVPKHKIWTIKLANASNPNDFTNWSNKKIPVGPVLSDEQKQRIIQSMINEKIDRNTVMYYTQRLGNSWKEKYDSLHLNEAELQQQFRSKLDAAGLSGSFQLYYYDTTARSIKNLSQKDKIKTQITGVQYKTIWDNDNSFVVQASIKNPFLVLLNRQWITISATLLLVILVLFCMYSMYGVISKQKKLAAIKNDFINNITHELKTPLATVGAAIDALQYFDGWEDKKRKEKYLNTSRMEVEKLNRLISQIMDTAIYEKDFLQLNKEWICFRDLLEEVAGSLSIQYGINLKYTITDRTESSRVFGDKNHLTGAIKNILENAIKYHPQKNQIKLDISVTTLGDSITLEIKDNGPGIPAEYQPFLFDKFYRVPNGNQHDIKGFGLGLYFVRKIIIAHNGVVAIRSKLQHGTSVLIQLPVPHESN